MIGRMSDVTDLIPIESSSGEVVANVPVEPLTKEENDFAFAFVEFGGNIRRAWLYAIGEDPDSFKLRDLETPRQMLRQANVAMRIRDLQEVGEEHLLVTKASHLLQLAEIRDVALSRGEMKVGLMAEKARGEVAGLYAVNQKKAPQQGVTIVINNKNDLSI